MIGELTKGACSMFGANSTATPDGKLLQLRALDWDVDGQLTTYVAIGIGTAFDVLFKWLPFKELFPQWWVVSSLLT